MGFCAMELTDAEWYRFLFCAGFGIKGALAAIAAAAVFLRSLVSSAIYLCVVLASCAGSFFIQFALVTFLHMNPAASERVVAIIGKTMDGCTGLQKLALVLVTVVFLVVSCQDY